MVLPATKQWLKIKFWEREMDWWGWLYKQGYFLQDVNGSEKLFWDLSIDLQQLTLIKTIGFYFCLRRRKKIEVARLAIQDNGILLDTALCDMERQLMLRASSGLYHMITTDLSPATSQGWIRCSYGLMPPWTSTVKVSITINDFLFIYLHLPLRLQLHDDRDYISVVH